MSRFLRPQHFWPNAVFVWLSALGLTNGNNTIMPIFCFAWPDFWLPSAHVSPRSARLRRKSLAAPFDLMPVNEILMYRLDCHWLSSPFPSLIFISPNDCRLPHTVSCRRWFLSRAQIHTHTQTISLNNLLAFIATSLRSYFMCSGTMHLHYD